MNQSAKDTQAEFVLLFHQVDAANARDDHWDLMLEQNGKLLTWALKELPAPGKSVQAKQLDAHRIGYLDYEGPIGGDRGSVSRLLRGYYSWKQGLEQQVAVLEFANERWEVAFRKKIGSSEVANREFLIEVELA